VRVDDPDRLLLFVHYNPHGELSDHVVYSLTALRPLFRRIHLASNSPLRVADRERLGPIVDTVVERPNLGFDFRAWREMMEEYGWDQLGTHDSVTIMNDTCFGPIVPIEPVFEEMENRDADFWGISDHPDTRVDPPSGLLPVPYHLQSYFMSFKRDVVVSPGFRAFWETVEAETSIDRVIVMYETRLTQSLWSSGFRSSVYCRPRQDKRQPDIATLRPGELVRVGSPFVKIKGFLLTPAPSVLLKLVQEKGSYDVELIRRHIRETFPPHVALPVFPSVPHDPAVAAPVAPAPSVPVLVHLHLSESALQELSEYSHLIERLRTISAGVTMCLTVPTEGGIPGCDSIVRDGDRVFAAADPFQGLRIVACGSDAEFVFHMSAAPHVDPLISRAVTEATISALVDPGSAILARFVANPRLGVLALPPLPALVQSQLRQWLDARAEAVAAFRSLPTDRKVDLGDDPFPVIHPESAFWVRADAIKPLLEASSANLASRPGTILYLIAPVAWTNGYFTEILCGRTGGYQDDSVFLLAQMFGKRESVWERRLKRYQRQFFVIRWFARAIRRFLKPVPHHR
jgi:rhamnosyltransferase